MKSIRELVGCINRKPFQSAEPWQGDISVLEDFWCYTLHPDAAIIEEAGEAGLSLLRQARLLQGKHIHLNLIRVGNDQFLDADEQDINNAVYKMRDICAAADLGVARIQHHGIPTNQANGRHVIDDDQEARDLTNAWTVHNDALDVFIVRDSWIGDSGRTVWGRSKTDGPCDKDAKERLTGSVISLRGNFLTGILMAHEVGHYLGLEHIGDLDAEETANLPPFEFFDIWRDNLMFPSLSHRTVQILSNQAAQMKTHCFVKSGC